MGKLLLGELLRVELLLLRHHSLIARLLYENFNIWEIELYVMIRNSNNSESNKVKKLSKSSSRSNKSRMRKMIAKVASFGMPKRSLMALIRLEANLVDLLTNVAVNYLYVIIILHMESLFLK